MGALIFLQGSSYKFQKRCGDQAHHIIHFDCGAVVILFKCMWGFLIISLFTFCEFHESDSIINFNYIIIIVF